MGDARAHYCNELGFTLDIMATKFAIDKQWALGPTPL